MPHFFGDSSVVFLERFQFIRRCRHGGVPREKVIPTDSLSLMDVLLHTNSTISLSSYLAQSLDAMQACRGGGGGGGGLNRREEDDGEPIVSAGDAAHALHHRLQEDIRDFDYGLSEELLAPLLLSFLSFYLDQNIDMTSIRRALRAFFETTPYLHDSRDDIDSDDSNNNGERDSSLYSNIAVLLLNLSTSLLVCQLVGWKMWEKRDPLKQRRVELPLLPWLQSRPEYVTCEVTEYWWISQRLHVASALTKDVRIYRRRKRETAEDENAFSVSYAARKRSREEEKRNRNNKVKKSNDPELDARGGSGFISAETKTHEEESSCKLSPGIFPIPYDVQMLILRYLSPRALSAAFSVCRMWKTLIANSTRMSFYLYVSRMVTRTFVHFFEEDWGEAWVRVDELTTFRRVGLDSTRLRFAQENLQAFRLRILSNSPREDFAERIYRDLGTCSSAWRMLRQVWDAIGQEMKRVPFLGFPDLCLPSLFGHGSISYLCKSIPHAAAVIQMRMVLMSMDRSARPSFSFFGELLKRWTSLLPLISSPPCISSQ